MKYGVINFVLKFGTVTEFQLYSISERVKAMNNSGN